MRHATGSVRRLVWRFAGVVILVAGFLALGGPAHASGSICTYGSSEGNTYTCLYVNGNGAFVSYAVASAHVFNSTRTLQVCLHAPNGSRIGCTMYDVVEPGWTLKFTWAPHSYVTSGAYTAVTWRKNSDASTTEIGAVAVLVQLRLPMFARQPFTTYGGELADAKPYSADVFHRRCSRSSFVAIDGRFERPGQRERQILYLRRF